MALEEYREVTFPALRITQPIGDFFIGGMRAKDLYKIAFFDIRGIEHKDGVDQYLGVQRKISDKRVDEISRYVNTIDATFPTAIILAVDERCAQITQIDCTSQGLNSSSLYSLTLRNIPEPEDGDEPVLFRQIARVLDGQHRIAGLKDYDGDFEVNVAVFVGLDIASQASIFSVVNLAQTKVNASLVYDLFSYDQTRSPEKTAHEIAVALDGAKSSPFFGKIKRLGIATEGRFEETLSQATFVRAILPYITDDVLLDRDIGRRSGHYPEPTHAQARKMIFRRFFVKNQDVEIGSIIWNYFSVVEKKWPSAWAWSGSGRILNKTTGFQALMKFLRPAYLHITSPGNIPSRESFEAVFSDVTLTDDDFTTDKFKPGSLGVGALLTRLLSDSGVKAT